MDIESKYKIVEKIIQRNDDGLLLRFTNVSDSGLLYNEVVIAKPSRVPSFSIF